MDCTTDHEHDKFSVSCLMTTLDNSQSFVKRLITKTEILNLLYVQEWNYIKTNYQPIIA